SQLQIHCRHGSQHKLDHPARILHVSAPQPPDRPHCPYRPAVGTSSATIHTYATSLATGFPAHRSCALVDFLCRAHCSAIHSAPPVPERRILGSSRVPSTASLPSSLRTISATRPSVSGLPSGNRTPAPVADRIPVLLPHSSFRCLHRYRRHYDAPLPVPDRRRTLAAPVPCVERDSSSRCSIAQRLRASFVSTSPALLSEFDQALGSVRDRFTNS